MIMFSLIFFHKEICLIKTIGVFANQSFQKKEKTFPPVFVYINNNTVNVSMRIHFQIEWNGL